MFIGEKEIGAHFSFAPISSDIVCGRRDTLKLRVDVIKGRASLQKDYKVVSSLYIS